MSAAARVAGWFLAPAEPSARPVSPPVPGPAADQVAVIGRGAEGVGAAAVLAASLALRASCAVLLCWPGEPAPGPGVPGHRAARRTAARLGAEGVAVWARGRLVIVALPADEEDAVRAARRAGAALGAGVPLVLALGGARGPAFEAVLADMPDVRVGVSGGEALDVLTRLGAQAVAGAAVGEMPVPSRLRRRAALAGLHVPARTPRGPSRAGA